MPYRPYHEYLRELLKQHESVDGFDNESAFMRDASRKLLRLAEHSDACQVLQRQRLDIGALAREIGLPDDGPAAPEPKPAGKQDPAAAKPRRRPRKNRPWTDKELAFLTENYDRMTSEEISRRLPGRTPLAVRSKASKLRAPGDDGRNPGTAPAAPVPETGVLVPNRLSDLDVPARLKAMRLYRDATVKDVSVKTKIDKKTVYAVENGMAQPDEAFMNAMASMYGMDPRMLLEGPVGNLVPIRPDDDIHQRLKAVRCRCGMSIDVLARKAALRPRDITAFETDTVPNGPMTNCLAMALGVPSDLLRTTNPV